MSLVVCNVENEVLWIQLQGLYSQHFIFFVTYKWAQKACIFVLGKPFHITVIQHSNLLSLVVCNVENEVLWIQLQGLYSQHFILFVTYKWAQKAWAFVLGKPFQITVMQCSNLLSLLVGYKENEVLWIQLQGLYSQHFILFVTYKWAQKAWIFVLAKPFNLTVMQHSNLLSLRLYVT